MVVPLDGSDVAERAIPVAMAVAARADARLRLVHVFVPGKQGGGTERAGPGMRSMDEAESYMSLLLQRVRTSAGDVVSADVMLGDVTDVLLHEIRKQDVQLVVMSTHGTGGLRGTLMGSIATRLVHGTHLPVLVSGPSVPGWGITRHDEGPVLDVEIANIIVALDGSVNAASALGPAAWLARMFGARLTLVAVVPAGELGSTLPGGSGAMLGPSPLEAERALYLDRMAERLSEEGVPAHRRLIRSDETATAILRAAIEEDADMIAMSTHARGPAMRVILGSVSSAVVASSRIPVLLYRPADV